MFRDDLPTEFSVGPGGASVWCVAGESQVKDVASGPPVSTEAWLQSEERPQGWSHWIWTGEVSHHTFSVRAGC